MVLKSKTLVRGIQVPHCRHVQECRHRAFQIFPILSVIILMLLDGSNAQAFEVAVSYSFPEVSNLAPPPDEVVEGSIIATFHGDEPMQPLPGDVTLEQLDSNTWYYRFNWDWTEPISVTFMGGGAHLITIEAAPQPVIPLGSQPHDLMTFNITTDKAGLWSPPSGVYVYGDFGNFLQHGVDWERFAQVDFFNPADNHSFSEPIGLRIHGGWSRRFSQKSFRFYFDDYGASNEIIYDFFDGQPTTFQRLVLRTHQFPFNCFNSDILESIWLEREHLGSRIQPAVAYVNNEFWGVYSLRERLDDEFLEVTHGLEPDTYTFIKDGVVEKGDPNDWANFIASFEPGQEFASHAWYADIATRIDLNSYVDWLLINIFAATADNGFDANLAQLKEGDGPWTFIMWDEDDTFFPENLNADFFQFFSSENQTEFEANWPPIFNYNGWEPSMQLWANMFRGFMQNSEFKAFFFDRLDELQADDLAPNSLVARIDAIISEQGPEMDLHAQRWQWESASEFTDFADQLKTFIHARHGIVHSQAASFKEQYRVPVELVQFEATLETEGVKLSWATQGERYNAGFMVMRKKPGNNYGDLVDSFFQNPTLVGQNISDDLIEYSTIDASPNAGELNDYYLIWVDQHQQSYTLPWIESVWVAHWGGLVFNELMADNDAIVADAAGEFDDWVEIYNGSNLTINLENLYITDDITVPTKHQMSAGFELSPNQHLMLWADGTTAQGPDHLSFSLSAAGEGIYLFAPDGETLITMVEFQQQVTDVSLTRVPDGNPNWVYSAVPSPEAANGDPRTQSLLRLNEWMGLNSGQVADEMGEFDPWLEVFNPLPVAIEMSGLALKLAGITNGLWTFNSWQMQPGHQLLWLDGQPEQGDTHAPYVFTPGLGSLNLIYAESIEQIDTLNWLELPVTGSIARVPDGHGPWQEGVDPTPALTNPHPDLTSVLRINEFMALNGSIIADETGVFEDWVEIYNSGPDPVFLGDMYLTDDLTVPTRWAFPDTGIAAGEYLIVWCDSDPLDGPLHTNFKLSGSGEAIGLYANVEEVIMHVDSYTFGPQTLDVSEGRISPSLEEWGFFQTPSPGSPNNLTSPVIPGIILTSELLPNYPNPFNPRTTVVYSINHPTDVRLSVHDVRGRLVAVLIQDWQAAGRHQVVWQGTDLMGSPVASGVYLIRLQAGETLDSRRILLLK